MTFKALNNSVRLNSLILIILIFGAYFYKTDINISLPTINQHSIAIYKAIEKVKRFHILYQVNNIFNIKNRFSTSLIYNLLLNSPILVFCKKNIGLSGLWEGLYKLLIVQSKTAVIELCRKPT